MIDKPFSEYAARNSAPILEVLERELEHCSNVLEIGSGTGQHAATFAASLPFLTWQTSDRHQNHSGIQAWVDSVRLPNLLPPLSLDVLSADVEADNYDAVFSANTAHIMSYVAVEAMFRIVGTALRERGKFCLYGPFRLDGAFNAASNAAFDASLRAQNPDMGIRDIEDLDATALDNGLVRQRLFAMPANNHIAVWERT